MKYLLRHQSGVAAVADVPHDCPLDYFDRVTEAFCQAAGVRVHEADWVPWDHVETVAGVPYTWELAGSRGARFTMYPGLRARPSQVAEAKPRLRATRDVVSIRTRRIKRMIEFQLPAL